MAGLKISHVLQARVGALLARGIAITPALLELAAPGSPHERLLLDPALAQTAPKAEAIREIIARYAFPQQPPVVVVQDDGLVLALEDEVLAEFAWEDDASDEASPPAAPEERAVAARGPTESGRQEGGVFSGPEVERLKLVALTSSDIGERITAMRQLGFAPLSDEDKGRVFLTALADEDADVRAEAARLLVKLGLSRESAEDVVRLERGQPREKSYAVGAIARRLARGEELEVAAGLVVLIRRLRVETDLDLRRRILAALRENAGVIVRSEPRTVELVKQLLSILPGASRGLLIDVRRLVAALARELPKTIGPVLRQALADTDDRNMRQFLLLTLAAVTEDDARRQALAAEMAREVARREDEGVPPGDRVDFRALGAALMEMPALGIPALIDVFPRAARSQQPYILRLLSDTCRFREGVTPALKNDVAQVMLQALSGTPFDVRNAVMDSLLPADPDITPERRRALADALQDSAVDINYDTALENVERTLAEMGLPAAGPLLERLHQAQPKAVRKRAARVLGALGRSAADRKPCEDKETVEDILRRLQQVSIEDAEARDPALVATGRVAAGACFDADTTSRIATFLFERQGDRETNSAVLTALSWVVSGPHCRTALVQRVGGLFKTLLNQAGPEFAAQSVTIDGDMVFQIGGELEFYTDVVPACISGLRRVVCGPATPRRLREELTGFLLERWRAHLSREVDWGPLNQHFLAQALQQIGQSRRTSESDRAAIVKALSKRLSLESVMRSVTAILADVDKPGTMATLASAVMRRILDRRNDRGHFADTERDVALSCLARLAGRRYLATNAAPFRNLRQIAIDVLFEGLKDGVPGVAEHLVALRDSESLPKALREDIAERLRVYHSVAPVS